MEGIVIRQRWRSQSQRVNNIILETRKILFSWKEDNVYLGDKEDIVSSVVEIFML